ncbi:hypothetical protein FACS189434_06540 [Bacteroidia bacterium]|nr:hypothetical protein FACS189434_06540 [Bacteroidia bacterium]
MRIEAKNTQKLAPKKRKKGAGLKKGQTNNPEGRPVGALNKANTTTKKIISTFYLVDKDGDNKTQLEKILWELRISEDNNNGLELEYKINTSLKYLRFIASYYKDEETETEIEDVKNILQGMKKINAIFD